MGGGLHGAVTVVLSAVLIVLGIVMVASTVARGGGPTTYGVIVGVCFVAAGAARLWLATRRPDA